MAEKLMPAKHHWRLVVPTPPREVFAVMEQMCGIPPFRFEVVGPDRARVVEFERNSLVGHWRQLARTDAEGRQRTDGAGGLLWKARVRWMACTARQGAAGTEVAVEASSGRGAMHRALQLVQLLSRGVSDRRTIYRDRHIPDGPVSLVASWAGMLYPVYQEPRWGAPRGEGVHTASRLVAIGNVGPFVKVRLASGVEGYIERDQLVPAPEPATREAQEETAVKG